MGSIRKLRVAEDAHQLAIEVYRATENFPKPETFGLRAQMRSAAISVPSTSPRASAATATASSVASPTSPSARLASSGARY
jgi:four helix bundle protein